MTQPKSKYVFVTKPGTGKSEALYVLQTAKPHTNNRARARKKITLPTLKFMENKI